MQNVIFSLLLLAVLIPSALIGIMTVAIAVFFHEGSELLAVANGLRVAKGINTKTRLIEKIFFAILDESREIKWELGSIKKSILLLAIMPLLAYMKRRTVKSLAVRRCKRRHVRRVGRESEEHLQKAILIPRDRLYYQWTIFT